MAQTKKKDPYQASNPLSVKERKKNAVHCIFHPSKPTTEVEPNKARRGGECQNQLLPLGKSQ